MNHTSHWMTQNLETTPSRPRRTPPVLAISSVSLEQSPYDVVPPTEVNRLQRHRLVGLLDEALLIATPTLPTRNRSNYRK